VQRSVLCENGAPSCYLSHCAFIHSSFKKFPEFIGIIYMNC